MGTLLASSNTHFATRNLLGHLRVIIDGLQLRGENKNREKTDYFQIRLDKILGTDCFLSEFWDAISCYIAHNNQECYKRGTVIHRFTKISGEILCYEKERETQAVNNNLP